jgi:hypothetical protein
MPAKLKYKPSEVIELDSDNKIDDIVAFTRTEYTDFVLDFRR